MKRGQYMYLALPILAGIAIALQGVFSNRVSEQSGVLQAVFLIHAFGLITAILILLIGKENYGFLKNINLYAVFGGALGVVIIFSISRSITMNGVLTTVLVSVIIQMILSKVIDHFGWFGIERNPVNWGHIFSIGLMIIAVIIYQRSNQ